MKVLVVCDGNTCRSPMAAALAQQVLGKSSIVESCGLETADGEPANQNAILVMNEIGIDISRHRTKDISRKRLDAFDLVVALTPKIASKLEARTTVGVVSLDVADPYGGDPDVYRRTRDDISDQLTKALGSHP